MHKPIEANVDVVKPLTFRLTLAQLIAFICLIASGAYFTQRVTDGQNSMRNELREMRTDIKELRASYTDLNTTLRVLQAQQSNTQAQVDELSSKVSILAKQVDSQRTEFDRLSDILAKQMYKPSPLKR